MGDEKRLMQVLNNLLSNAVKFTEQGQVTLAVNSQEIRPGTFRVVFKVTDTGIGIPPNRQRFSSPFIRCAVSGSLLKERAWGWPFPTN